MLRVERVSVQILPSTAKCRHLRLTFRILRNEIVFPLVEPEYAATFRTVVRSRASPTRVAARKRIARIADDEFLPRLDAQHTVETLDG